MRTVNFRDQVLYALARKMGLDPTADLLSDQAATFTSFINTWVRKLYDRFDWPEWTIIEQRTLVGHYVAWNQSGKNVIGRVFKVYLADPQSVNFPVDVAFKTNQAGIHCGFLVPSNGTVWVKYIQPAPRFTTVPFSTGTAYFPGDIVFDPVTGDCYQCMFYSQGPTPTPPVWSPTTTYAMNDLVWDTNTQQSYASVAGGNLNHNPITTTGFWTPATYAPFSLVAFPYVLADLVVRGAYADALRDEGQTDKANAEEQAMQQIDSTLRVAGSIREGYDAMTDQVPPAPRYRTSAATTP